MGRILMLLLTFTWSVAWTQETAEPATEKGAFEFSIYASPNYSFRSLSTAESELEPLVDVRNGREKALFGYALGIKTYYNVNDALQFSLGLGYSLKGFQTTDIDFQIDPPDPSFPYESGYFVYKYQYLDLPLEGVYRVQSKKIDFYFHFGVMPSVYINETITSHLKENSGKTVSNETDSTVDNSRLIFSGLVGLGASLQLGPSTHLDIGPIFRHGITAITDAPIKGYHYSLGLEANLRFN